MNGQTSSDRIERWGLYEVWLTGAEDGNPFLDVRLSAQFRHKHRVVEAEGFYDGDGRYCVRFSPDALGAWSYVTRSDCSALDGKTGAFTCVEPSPANHGPVAVCNTYHFAYADGTPHFPVGSTCYAWTHQGDDLEKQTLATLGHAPFNKLRMCVFPKHYVYNRNEPPCHPFARAKAGGWDFSRFNPRFFQHLEQRVGDLCQLGIEADIILFHPYDRWGYSTMPAEADDRYLRYVVARLAAYRNVWWSMANEYDLMASKRMSDWDRFFRIVRESDPYQHLCSIHNCRRFYDHRKPWVSHCSVQRSDLSRAREWRQQYGKPVVVDECQYEGDIEQGFGNIPGWELVHRFWLGTIAGCYVGHGETYRHPEDILWWAKGGVLHGESPSGIAFLRRILEEGPAEGIEPISRWAGGREGEYYLFYFGVHQPSIWTFDLPPSARYKLEVIDTWAMTIAPVEGTFGGRFQVALPGKPYLAVRIRKAG